MTAHEHKELVLDEVKKMIADKVKGWPVHMRSYKALEAILAPFEDAKYQHIITTHLGYMRPIEETAKVISDRLIDSFHQACAQS